MNQQERDVLAKAVIRMAYNFGVTKAKEEISLYIDLITEVEDRPLDFYLQKIGEYGRDKSNRFFPNPAQMKFFLFPTQVTEDVGEEIATKVIDAVAKFGYTDPSGARTYIGELGWECLKGFGGWHPVCTLLGTDEMTYTTLRAQLRESAKAKIRLKAAGYDGGPINYPGIAAPAPVAQIEAPVKEEGTIDPSDMVKNFIDGISKKMETKHEL